MVKENNMKNAFSLLDSFISWWAGPMPTAKPKKVKKYKKKAKKTKRKKK